MKNVDLEEIKKGKNIKELIEFGIINIDKPSGPTSFDVSEFVMKTLGLRKTSHFGTLDPQVTGVLPIALNRACKLTGFFLGEDKEYVGIMRIHEDIEMEKIQDIINKKFLGKIIQKPPVKSRVKRVEREREVKKFKLLEKDGKDILFEVECQGGTYIRKLIDDLGKDISGAHMLELRRVRAGIFSESGIFFVDKKHRAGIFKEEDKIYPVANLYDFEKAVKEYKSGNEKELRKIIIPGEVVSLVYPVVEIEEESIGRILKGQPVYKKNLVKKTDFEKDKIICVFSKDRFIGMFKVINQGEFFARSEFTLQEIK